MVIHICYHLGCLLGIRYNFCKKWHYSKYIACIGFTLFLYILKLLGVNNLYRIQVNIQIPFRTTLVLTYNSFKNQSLYLDEYFRHTTPKNWTNWFVFNQHTDDQSRSNIGHSHEQIASHLMRLIISLIRLFHRRFLIRIKFQLKLQLIRIQTRILWVIWKTA